MKWHHKVKRAATAWNGGAIDLHLYAVVSVALISGLLLWWTNVSWRENLAAYQPVFSKLRQIRADVVRGYLGAVRSLAGESDIHLADVDAFFEQTTSQITDIAGIMTSSREKCPTSTMHRPGGTAVAWWYLRSPVI